MNMRALLKHSLPNRLSRDLVQARLPSVPPACQGEYSISLVCAVRCSPSRSSSFRIHYVSLSMKDKPIAALDSCLLQGHSFPPPRYPFFGDLSDVTLGLSISLNPSRRVYRDWRCSQAKMPLTVCALL